MTSAGRYGAQRTRLAAAAQHGLPDEPDRLTLVPALALILALLGVFALCHSAAADSVSLLNGAREAAEARARLVVEAQEEILASYFIVGNDAFSMTALALLRDAARRGVKVRLLVDAQWNKIPGNVQAHLLKEGVSIRVYHPFRLHRPGWVTRRLHDKLLIVDGQQLLTGGRNIESPYFDLGHQLQRRNYLDCDVLLKGDAASDARRYFLELWKSRHVRLAAARNRTKGLAEAARKLDRHQDWIEARIAESRSAETHGKTDSPRLGGLEVGAVRFLHDPVGKKAKGPGVGHALRDLFEQAEASVLIESPYLVPSRSFLAALDRALARGVRVRILTNSLASTDNLWPLAGYVRHRKNLVRRGVELWEYVGRASLHAKNAVIDGRRLIVGSYNLDPRSERLNTETALVFEHSGLANQLLAEQEAHLAEAVPIDARGWPEGATEPFPGAPRGKLCKLRLLRLIAPLIKKQL